MMQNQIQLNQEDKLLLFCARAKLSDESLFKAKELINSDLNWDYLLEKASQYNIMPLLYHSLWQVCENGSILHKVMNRLRQAYQANVYNNMCLFNEFGDVLKAFNKAGIEVVVLKGAALAETVYQNLALRQMNDLDILIQDKDIKTAHSVLSKIGFQPEEDLFHPHYYFKNHFHLPYVHRAKMINIGRLELHWNIFSSFSHFRFSINEIWNRARSFTKGNLRFHVLDLEDNIIYLSAHLERHCLFLENILDEENVIQILLTQSYESRLLRWLIDIYFLIEQNKDEISWENVSERACRWNIVRPVRVVLTLLNQVFGTVVPPLVIFNLKGMDDENLSTTIHYWLFRLQFDSQRGNKKKKDIIRTLFIQHKSLQYRPIMISNLLCYLFPNKNYFLQESRKVKILIVYRSVHFLKALCKISSTSIETLSLLFFTKIKICIEKIYSKKLFIKINLLNKIKKENPNCFE